MNNYDKERMELSTRDKVAMANYTEINEGRGTAKGGVYLDISHKDKEFIMQKFLVYIENLWIHKCLIYQKHQWKLHLQHIIPWVVLM